MRYDFFEIRSTLYIFSKNQYIFWKIISQSKYWLYLSIKSAYRRERIKNLWFSPPKTSQFSKTLSRFIRFLNKHPSYKSWITRLTPQPRPAGLPPPRSMRCRRNKGRPTMLIRLEVAKLRGRGTPTPTCPGGHRSPNCHPWTSWEVSPCPIPRPNWLPTPW
jgi:hypothetical protein